MALNIDTFSNISGGNVLFKAFAHPLAARAAKTLLAQLQKSSEIACYDPLGYLDAFLQFYPCDHLPITSQYVQDIEKINEKCAPITDIGSTTADTLFILSFETDQFLSQIKQFLPEGIKVVGLDGLKLPDEMLSDTKNYLNPLNFATNFAFFRDSAEQHTRVVTGNYWSGYGAKDPYLWLCLFDDQGQEIKSWTQKLPPAHGLVTLDSAEILKQQNIPSPFLGQLFIHVIGAAGHDVVKYALDFYGDKTNVLTCTHDANSWPADLYAGIPAPQEGEQILLWVQNSHPNKIPKGEIKVNVMGETHAVPFEHEVAAFGIAALDLGKMMPQISWPKQLEIQAGKYFVRPRYEVITPKRKRMAHANVERTDLKSDPQLKKIGNLMGKGFVLPAPLLPTSEFRSIALPTPMSTAQTHLPLKASIYSDQGKLLAEHAFGNLPRNHDQKLDFSDLVPEGIEGHIELTYDFSKGDVADGWLHGLFRYEHKKTNHVAETSFGSHIFNTVLTYKNEPQSYSGRAPGLTTKLFLRVGHAPYDTMCHLTYPASTPWHETSTTFLILIDGQGHEIVRTCVNIPCGGSYLFKTSEIFPDHDFTKPCYVVINDRTCRLFGYHGLLASDQTFSFDHMFGF